MASSVYYYHLEAEKERIDRYEEVNELMRDKGYLKKRKPRWHRYNSYEGDQGASRAI